MITLLSTERECKLVIIALTGSMYMQVWVDIQLYQCISVFPIYTKIRILLGYGIQFGGIAFNKNSSSAGYLVGSMYHVCQNAGAARVIMKTG